MWIFLYSHGQWNTIKINGYVFIKLTTVDQIPLHRLKNLLFPETQHHPTGRQREAMKKIVEDHAMCT